MTVLEFIEDMNKEPEQQCIKFCIKEINNDILFEGWYKKTPYNLLNKKICNILSFRQNYMIYIYPSK